MRNRFVFSSVAILSAVAAVTLASPAFALGLNLTASTSKPAASSTTSCSGTGLSFTALSCPTTTPAANTDVVGGLLTGVGNTLGTVVGAVGGLLGGLLGTTPAGTTTGGTATNSGNTTTATTNSGLQVTVNTPVVDANAGVQLGGSTTGTGSTGVTLGVQLGGTGTSTGSTGTTTGSMSGSGTTTVTPATPTTPVVTTPTTSTEVASATPVATTPVTTAPATEAPTATTPVTTAPDTASIVLGSIGSNSSLGGTVVLPNSEIAPVTVPGTDVLAPVPEPASWLMMIFGFGFVGLCLRNSRNSRKRAVRLA
jgi:hypothetical protein